VLLPEDHVPLRAVQRPPLADAPLECAPDARRDHRMTAQEFFKNGDRPQVRNRLKHGDNLCLPYAVQRIGTAAAARRLLLRRQPRIVPDAVAARGTEPGLGSSGSRGVCLAKTHEQPHLVVVDVEAGQASIPLCLEESHAWPGRPEPPDAVPEGVKRALPLVPCLRSGYALPPSRHQRHSHPD